MQGRHPQTEILLSDEEKNLLEKIVRSKKTEARLVERARIILLTADKKLRNQYIADKVGCSRQIVFKWRKRFCKRRLAGLKDNPRSGKPATFTAKQRAEILALATKKPADEGKHFTDWSTRTLAEHAVGSGIVSEIHWTTINEWLRTADIKPHKWQYWLNSTDPEFKKK